jgi:hypothetical protein
MAALRLLENLLVSHSPALEDAIIPGDRDCRLDPRDS